MDDRVGCIGAGDEFRLVVDLERVRDALVVGLDAAVLRYGRFLAVPHDFYWETLEPSLDQEPGNPGVASLVDDYDEGCEILVMDAEDREALAWHSLDHLGGLISVLWDLDDFKQATPEQVRASGQAP